ncbi:MAG: hypothetical protein JST55_10450 [Bacteroidetes bacterium]|nr:hypothetical protein [Bacteroidota bacterium]
MRIFFKIIFLISFAIILSSCSSSTEYEEKTENTETNENTNTVTYSEENGNKILSQAKIEQQNRMYSPSVDSTYLYWLNNKLILLYNTTKCNVYALNTLQKSGFKTPKVNALCRDLYDTTRFNDIFPYVKITDNSDIRKGDLVIWRGHVILFDYLFLPNKQKRVYAKAWWAGTSKADDGETVINNVIYGKYELKGDFIVRRPVKN